jgi:hypothetical protein
MVKVRLYDSAVPTPTAFLVPAFSSQPESQTVPDPPVPVILILATWRRKPNFAYQ